MVKIVRLTGSTRRAVGIKTRKKERVHEGWTIGYFPPRATLICTALGVRGSCGGPAAAGRARNTCRALSASALSHRAANGTSSDGPRRTARGYGSTRASIPWHIVVVVVVKEVSRS